jgi:SOS-response transcriptional repressor LexA
VIIEGDAVPLSDEVRKLREEKGFTQKELAAAAGIAQGYVAMLEQGQRTRPTRDVLNKLAAALGVNAADLTASPDELEIPLVGAVGAGPGRDEEFESGTTLRVHELFAPGCFAYKVRGQSMQGHSILNGDHVIIRSAYSPGEVVVVWLSDLRTCVLKKLRKAGKSLRLEAVPSLDKGEERYSSRDLEEGDHVYGALVGVIRRV